MKSYFSNQLFKSFVIVFFGLNAVAANAQQVAFQGFEGTGSDNWGYTSSPAFYNLGDDFWEIRTSTPEIATGYDGHFVGGVDLKNSNNSTGLTTLTFDPVAISTKVDVKLRFRYVGYDTQDYIYLEIFYDNGTDWSTPDAVEHINAVLQSDSSDGWEEAVHTVYAGPTHVRARLVVFQNGSDNIGVDAFEVVVNSDPDPVLPPAPTFVTKFGSAGSGNGQFNYLEGIAINPINGDIWVADRFNYRVQIFNSEGVYQSQFGSEGSGNGQFNDSPLDITFDASGNAWVVDTQNHRIQKFNSSGTYLSQFGSFGTGNGQFDFPEGIAIHPTTGDIWVADKENARVQIFNSSGVYQSQFGSVGSGNGQFHASGAVSIDFDASGNAYVVDRGNHRIQKFNSSGVYQSQFGKIGGANHELLFPDGIAVHPSGYILIADKNNAAVKVYDSEGNYVFRFGEEGSGNGEFGPYGLVAIALDANDDAWIVDRANNRVQKFDINFSTASTSATVAARVFLQGAFNGTNLNTTLNSSIPTSQPYSINGHTGENASSIPANAVDWVLVELREAGSAAVALANTKVGATAGFLMSDGTIKATDGTSDLTIALSGNSRSEFYVVIYHRNHLPIMSADVVSEDGGVYSIDFTEDSDNTYQNVTALASLSGGKFGMVAGDIDNDGDIDATDLSTWRSNNGAVFSYSSNGKSDLNLDGVINAIDRNLYWKNNTSKTSQVPTT